VIDGGLTDDCTQTANAGQLCPDDRFELYPFSRRVSEAIPALGLELLYEQGMNAGGLRTSPGRSEWALRKLAIRIAGKEAASFETLNIDIFRYASLASLLAQGFGFVFRQILADDHEV
jgi:hypothetical protein